MKKRVLENNMENIIMLLYKSVAHPHFEYCLQIWSPHPWKKESRNRTSPENGNKNDKSQKDGKFLEKG